MNRKNIVSLALVFAMALCFAICQYSRGQGFDFPGETLSVQLDPTLSASNTTLQARITWNVNSTIPTYAKLVVLYESAALVDFPETPWNDMFLMPWWYESTTVVNATADFNNVPHNINFSLPNQPVSGAVGFYLARIDNGEPLTSTIYAFATQP